MIKYLSIVFLFILILSTQQVSASTPTSYKVIFNESGLPANTQWTVQVSTDVITSTGTLTFVFANGTYNYSVKNIGADIPSPRSGTLTVSGNNVEINVTFVERFNVTFKENGLQKNTYWGTDFNGTNYFVKTSSFVVPYLQNGSYNYSLFPVSYYSTVMYSNVVHISGTNVNITVNWTQDIYNVTFISTGFKTHQQWSVQIANMIKISNTSNISFKL